MAQTLKDAVKNGESVRTTSHGRGGAGNINTKPNNTVDPADLATPTIKSGTYTTGRGGTGKSLSHQHPPTYRHGGY